MRIITGKARGVRLETLEGNDTRPTSERTKEAVFSMLQFEIAGVSVLDLFAGSGQMGLEAASRGASSVHLVECGREARKIVEANIKKSRLDGVCRLFGEDAVSFLKHRTHADAYDIVFLDPPYKSELIDESLSLLFAGGLIKEASYIICESDRFDFMSENTNKHFRVLKTMKHGVAHITVLTPIFGEDV